MTTFASQVCRRNRQVLTRQRRLYLESLETRRLLATLEVVDVALNAQQPPAPDPIAQTTWLGQRSDVRDITVEFSENVNPITANDVRLTNLGFLTDEDPDIVFDLTSEHISVTNNLLVLSFERGELPDGAYQLDLFPAVTGKNGGFFDGNAPQSARLYASTICPSIENKLHWLTGDFSGDGWVSTPSDHSPLQAWEGMTVPPAPEYADLIPNGIIDAQDVEYFIDQLRGSQIIFPSSGCTTPTFPDPVVAHVGVNTDIVDITGVHPGPLPTSWAQQRSSILSIQVFFTEPVNDLVPADLVLTNLGVDVEADADEVVTLQADQISTENNVATISFLDSRLSDGVYHLQVLPTVTALDDDAELATPAWGKHDFIGDRENRFYLLRGDFTGDGIFDTQDGPEDLPLVPCPIEDRDLSIPLEYWCGEWHLAPAYIRDVDFNEDGELNIFDWNDWLNSFGNKIRFEQEPLEVVSTTVNTGIPDPDGLNGTPPPTTWADQRSDIGSIQVTFNQPVEELTRDNFVLINHGIAGDENTVEDLTDVEISQEGNVLTLRFDPFTLEDGSFSLQLSSVADLNGNPLVGNQPDNSYRIVANADNRFFKLTGAWSDDDGVSIFDFSTLAYWFGKPVGVAPEYVDVDVNHDGGVSIFDFTPFAENFAVGVTYPTTLVGESLVAAPLLLPPSDKSIRRDDKPSRMMEQPLDRQLAVDALPDVENRFTVGEAKVLRADTELEDLEDVLDEIGEDVFSAWNQ